jgi:hypothetical protein
MFKHEIEKVRNLSVEDFMESSCVNAVEHRPKAFKKLLLVAWHRGRILASEEIERRREVDLWFRLVHAIVSEHPSTLVEKLLDNPYLLGIVPI